MSDKRFCSICNAKIKLIDTIICRCRCNQIFCKVHRIDHMCSYDYYEEYKTCNNLVKIEERKLNKI